MQQKKKIQPILWLTLVENDVVKTRKLQKVKLDSNSKKFYNIVLLKIVLLLLIVYVFSLVINQDFWRYIMFQDRMSVRNLVVFSAI